MSVSRRRSVPFVGAIGAVLNVGSAEAEQVAAIFVVIDVVFKEQLQREQGVAEVCLK